MGAEKSILEKIIKQEVRNNNFVDSIQIYTYTAYWSANDINPSTNDIEIKCNIVVGYVREQFEINSILQIYYNLNLDHYIIFKSILLTYRNLDSKSQEYDYLEYVKKIIEDSIKLIEQIKFFFNIETNNQKIKSEKVSSSQIIIMLNMIINDCRIRLHVRINIANKEGIDSSNVLKLFKKMLDEQENTSIDSVEKNGITSYPDSGKVKRTGLLGAILSEDIYTFQNIQTQNPNKSERMYACYTFLFRNKKYVALYTINKNCVDENNGKNKELELKREIEQLKEEFLQNLTMYL